MFYIIQYRIPWSPYPSPGLTPRVNSGVLKVIFHQNWVLGSNSHKIGPIHKRAKIKKFAKRIREKLNFQDNFWKQFNVYPVWLTLIIMSYMHPGDPCHLYFEVLPRKCQYRDTIQVFIYLFWNLSNLDKVIFTHFWVWRNFWAVWITLHKKFYTFLWPLWSIFLGFYMKMAIWRHDTAHFLCFPNFVKFT